MTMLKLSRRTLASLSVLSALFTMPAFAQPDPYLGEIRCFAFSFAPLGWALADGQLMPISQNQALFALLGTTFGGDGQTTFALPNLQGRVIISYGQAGLSDGNHTIGEQGGSDTTTLTVAQMPAHSHTVAPLGANTDATSVSPAGMVPAAKARTTLYTNVTRSNVVLMASTDTSSVGGNQPIPILPPYLTMSCAIALQGIFPSRQ
jgi:microcystin-dependent protein